MPCFIVAILVLFPPIHVSICECRFKVTAFCLFVDQWTELRAVGTTLLLQGIPLLLTRRGTAFRPRGPRPGFLIETAIPLLPTRRGTAVRPRGPKLGFLIETTITLLQTLWGYRFPPARPQAWFSY